MTHTIKSHCSKSAQLLEVLDNYEQVLVVMHDNPDPDAIAAAWGLEVLIHEKLKKPVRLVGGGAIVRAENRRINVLSLDGVSPTLENLKSGQYPIEKIIYAVTRPNSSELAHSFLAFLKSDEARALILANGGLPGDR